MEFQVLGPVEVRHDGRRLDVGHSRQRCLLAVLLLELNRVVPTEQLIDRLWGAEVPASARNVLHGHVARLRSVLRSANPAGAGPTLTYQAGGYILAADPATLDLHEFRRLLSQARAAADDERAADAYRQALARWQGAPLGGVPCPGLDGPRVMLETEHFTALLDRNDVELRRGQHHELLPQLRELATEHPFDERLAAQVMISAYRSGTQNEALETYRQVQRRLADELGLDPGPELNDLYLQMLRADPAVAGPAQPPPADAGPVPAQLPHDIAGFVGRDWELAELNAMRASGLGQAVVISALDGAAGVGKTALAVHFGHEATADYPDGQLYLNLRGFDPDEPPMPPAEALGVLLRALGVAPERIPAAIEEQAALLRTMLSAKRMFLLLDNAATSEQVYPLLPGNPASTVLVTSRNRLSGLVARHGARRLTLDVLSPAEAVTLLERVLGAERLTAEAEAAQELARLCGFLPLALQVAAERAAAKPHLKLADLVGELAAERTRLDVLAVPDDEATAVRAALSWSYSALSPQAARAFRLLGLSPGPDISGAAAAVLTGEPVERMQRLLGELTGVHLLTEYARDRYRMHDLIRLYAAERARTDSADEWGTAIQHLLRWFLSTAIAADRLIAPRRRTVSIGTDLADVAPLRFADRNAALDWCEAERANLVAAIRLAAEAGAADIAWRLPLALGSFFNLRKHWSDWISTHQIGSSAAESLGDTAGQAWILTGLGIANGDLRRFDESLDSYRRALELHRLASDLLGEAATLNNLGVALGELNRHAEAIGYLRQALDITRQVGDHRGEGMTLDSLGLAYRDLGQFDESVACLKQALDICREVGDGRGEGFALNNLGETYRQAGSPEEAIPQFLLALKVREAAGDRSGEASTLDSLATTLFDTGKLDAAAQAWQRALSIFSELGDPRAETVRASLVRLRGTRLALRAELHDHVVDLKFPRVRARARPAVRAEKIHPPRNVPSRAL